MQIFTHNNISLGLMQKWVRDTERLGTPFDEGKRALNESPQDKPSLPALIPKIFTRNEVSMKNRYGISPKYWEKLGVKGRKMFNQIYHQSKQDWINPNGKPIPQKDWNTIRHNFAFLAASELIVK